jgi:NADH:ubiquinone oxidoreductase subunit H
VSWPRGWQAQLRALAWKVLVPLALAHLVVTGGLVVAT